MKTTTLLVATLLAASTGCQGLATPTGAEAPLQTRAPAAATVSSERDEAAASTSVAVLDGAPLATTAAPPVPVCDAQPAARGYYGLYANDAAEQGNVVLTFDDGPHPKFTPRVLDLLADKKMPATFFVVGRNISRDTYPLIQRIVAEGHTLGSHSYSHDVRMTNVATPDETVETIRSQHEVTTILIDIALLAESADDFDAMYRRDFQREPMTWMTGSEVRKAWRGTAERHEALLAERGFAPGTRPYAVLYSRPPGGGPYVEHDGAAGIALYDKALTELGMMNVLWHGASGDTVPGQRNDFAFLTKNMEQYAKKGGVLLIHDYMRPDALEESLTKIGQDGSLRVRTMEDAVQKKYACSAGTLGSALTKNQIEDVLFRGFVPAPELEPRLALQ
ncbi:MAG: polysaccharide deacetylase family protein [Myxococcales bacterium]|nr:polysaccharide deacetylase family protein [Myxococcales bacterium]